MADKFRQYVFTVSSGNRTLTHANCLKVATPVDKDKRSMCTQCESLSYIRKVVVKMRIKIYAAVLLEARLFGTPECVEKAVAEINADPVGQRHPQQVRKVTELSPFQLQSWVRSTFLSVRDHLRGVAYKTFLECRVQPCLVQNVTKLAKLQPVLRQANAQLQKFLAQPSADGMDTVKAVIAKACLEGKMDTHPVLQGLALTCLRVLERKEAGLAGCTQGRIKAGSAMHSEAARELAAEAGRLLSLHGGNTRLLKLFSAHTKPLMGIQEKLQQAGLPIPFNSFSSGLLRENLQLVDQRLSASSGTFGSALSYRTFMNLPG